MSPKIDAARQNFAAMRTTLTCPVCHELLELSANSFRCPSGHCFDLSAKNYLNLAPHLKAPSLYDEGLFAARRAVFAAGFYAPLAEALVKQAQALQHRLGRPINVLDAGCGEGYFAAQVFNAMGGQTCEMLAVDLAKPGLLLAAKLAPQMKCLLADLARLPLPDNSLDIILNVLSPANYQEFRRVLRPGGLLLKIAPGADYLREVRQAFNLPPGEKSEAGKLLAAAASSYTTADLRYTRPVTPEQRKNLLAMSPLSGHHTAQEADFTEVTIDLQMFAAELAGL